MTTAPETETAAEWVPIGDVTPWAKNPRNNAEAVGKVAESIRRFGFASPIIARKADGSVIAGHTRLAAAQLLGLDQIPVRFLDLDPADAALLALADNRLGEVASWNLPELSGILKDLQGELDLDVAGFSPEELEDLLREDVLLPDGLPLVDPKDKVTEVFIQVRAPLAVSAQTVERVQAAVADLRSYGVEVSVS